MFYETSGGGVTLSGGEPLLQPEFCEALLRQLRNDGIHTALDTCSDVPWRNFERLLPWTNLFLFDLKAVDPGVHRKCTGADNRTILENLRRLDACGIPFEIRMPLMPGWNDAEDDLRKAGGTPLFPAERAGSGPAPGLSRFRPEQIRGSRQAGYDAAPDGAGALRRRISPALSGADRKLNSGFCRRGSLQFPSRRDTVSAGRRIVMETVLVSRAVEQHDLDSVPNRTRLEFTHAGTRLVLNLDLFNFGCDLREEERHYRHLSPPFCRLFHFAAQSRPAPRSSSAAPSTGSTRPESIS